MTLRQLTYVVALAEHGHFGRAARACGVSQPTLSTQVQKLEEELGAELFDRTVRPVEPTEAGARVVAQARVTLEEAARLPGAVDPGSDALEGELRLGLIPTLAPYLMPLVVSEVRSALPRVDLVVRELTTEPLVAAVVEGRLDAALLATREEGPGLVRTPLFEEPFVAYVGEGHPLREEEPVRVDRLVSEGLWLLDEGHCLRDQALRLCELAARTPGGRPLRLRSGSLETLRHLVDRIGGYTLLPWLAVRYLEPSGRGRLRRFAQPAPGRTVRLLRRRASRRASLADAVARAASRVAAEEVPELRPTPWVLGGGGELPR